MKQIKVIETRKMKLSEISTKLSEGAFDVKADPLDDGQVTLFVNLMTAGIFFPPIRVFTFNGKVLILDGRTRFAALERLSRLVIDVEVVEFTTWADMLSYALAANMNGGKATPFPPTLRDFAKVIRELLKQGLEAPAVTQRLIDAGVPDVFAGRTVKSESHKKERRDILHACEDIESGRRNLDEACKHHGVCREKVEHNLANRGYGFDSFARDIKAKVIGIHKHYKRLVTGECSQDAIRAVVAIRAEMKNLSVWADAQEVAAH